jgi:hypothetical protein
MPPCVSAESRRTAVDLIRQTSGASKAPGRSVRFGPLLPSVPHVPRTAPQHPLQLLGSQSATETSRRVHVGALDERLAEVLVQAGATLVGRFSDVSLWIAHADEGAVDEKPTSRPLP